MSWLREFAPVPDQYRVGSANAHQRNKKRSDRLTVGAGALRHRAGNVAGRLAFAVKKGPGCSWGISRGRRLALAGEKPVSA